MFSIAIAIGVPFGGSSIAGGASIDGAFQLAGGVDFFLLADSTSYFLLAA